MKNLNLENWLKGLKSYKDAYEELEGNKKQIALSMLLGYLGSIDFILKN